MDDNFAGYPESLTELKADKEVDGSLWTPRDACISMLRDIDEGKFDPDSLFICFAYRDQEGRRKTGYKNATPNCISAIGLIEISKTDLMAG